MFIAKGGEKVSHQKLDDTEDIEVVIYSIEEVWQLVRDNKIVQALHTSTIFYALQKLGMLQY
jgi:hypothetical protein